MVLFLLLRCQGSPEVEESSFLCGYCVFRSIMRPTTVRWSYLEGV